MHWIKPESNESIRLLLLSFSFLLTHRCRNAFETQHDGDFGFSIKSSNLVRYKNAYCGLWLSKIGTNQYLYVGVLGAHRVIHQRYTLINSFQTLRTQYTYIRNVHICQLTHITCTLCAFLIGLHTIIRIVSNIYRMCRNYFMRIAKDPPNCCCANSEPSFFISLWPPPSVRFLTMKVASIATLW